jgi:two-component system, NtrC family, C4-dicarboxylate transport sensor histidine kinase DctB
MSSRAPTRPRELRLMALVMLGMVCGAVYVGLDVLSTSRLSAGVLGGWPAAEQVFDHTLPILAGGAFGVCVHYLRVRSELATAQEAAARAEALRARLQKVERDQAVWVLVATVLHELNNPLHALGLLLDELAEATGDVARRGDLLKRAHGQCERALSHLQTLRSMPSLGEPEMERVALDRVVADIAGDVGPIAAEDGLAVRLHCDQPVAANADPRYVRTIIENLLDNSIQSLRGAGRGHITIRVASEDGKAVVRVTDDGPAIDAEVRSALFEPLRTTKTHGLGLGLPIARALARAMRGDLSLDEGEVIKAFRLELPLRGTP